MHTRDEGAEDGAQLIIDTEGKPNPKGTDDQLADTDTKQADDQPADAKAAKGLTSTKDFSASKSGRYFAQQICRVCGREGHLKQNCPDRENLPCYLCGISGHQSRDCPNQLCFVCGLTGHQARLCPNRGAAAANASVMRRLRVPLYGVWGMCKCWCVPGGLAHVWGEATR